MMPSAQMPLAAKAGAGAGFALDPAGLEQLKRSSREGGSAGQGRALRQAAGQFEAVFMNLLLKSMRESLPKDGALDSETARTLTGMYDAQIAQKMAEKGVGLADMIVRQVEARSGPQPGAGSPLSAPASALDRPLEKIRAVTSEAVRASRVSAGVAGAANAAGAAGVTNATNAAGAAGVSARASAAAAAGAGDSAPREFVQRMWDSAKSASAATGMPAQFILGQAALESGWGRREIRHADGASSHNLFGIKAGATWKGATVDAVTTEFSNGVARKVTEKFRAYASYADSFTDYARLITQNPRYAATLNAGADADRFARSLQDAGYATDPHYAVKLARVIGQTVRAAA